MKGGAFSTQFGEVGLRSRGVIRFRSDVGCEKSNRFVRNGLTDTGTNVFLCDGLAEENIAEIAWFPFADASFDPVALGVSIGQFPEPTRSIELAELKGVGDREGNG